MLSGDGISFGLRVFPPFFFSHVFDTLRGPKIPSLLTIQCDGTPANPAIEPLPKRAGFYLGH